MKKTLLFVLLGAAAGVAGYQIYKKHAEQAEDIYTQEASEHQFEAYISKPVKAADADPDTAEERPAKAPETAADAEKPGTPGDTTVAEADTDEENSVGTKTRS